MLSIGDYLKLLRTSRKISLKSLSKEVNTSDSILQRLEKNHMPKNVSEIFRSIADYYKINVITLYLKANFITQNDLNGNKSIFKNCDELTEEEIKHIQNEIDFINSQKNKYR